jgi:hypothetical protein
MSGGMTTSGLEVPVTSPMPLAAKHVDIDIATATTKTPHIRSLLSMKTSGVVQRGGRIADQLALRWENEIRQRLLFPVPRCPTIGAQSHDIRRNIS